MWEAFWTLHAGRQEGMAGAQPIAVADVTGFCALAGLIDPTQRMELLRCVQAMDAEFLTIVSERQKAEQRKRSKGKGRRK